SSFDYDDALRLSDIKYANNVEGTFDYDAESRVVGFTYKTNNIAFIDHTIIRNEQGFKTHQLIDAGLIPLFPENQRKISTYNDVDQLTSEQIQTDAGWLDADYTWNANGCLSSIENEQTYEYDYNNRLIESIKGVNSAEYIYDASGARVARIFTDDTTSTTNFFIIDHTDSLKRPLAETDAEGNILRYYIWNGYMLLAHIDISENQNPTVTFYHQDELGNTLALTDSNGQVTDQFAYMPYGSTRHQVSPFTLHPSPFSRRPSPFLWLGGYGVFYEPELDIHLTVHRAYSADLRRFISPDPLGIDSFPNLYAYANMNPLFFIDPWGLCADGDPLGREDRYAERSQYLQDTREYINQSWPKGTHWFAELFLDMFDIGTSTSLEAERSGLSPETSWVLGSVEGIAWGVSFEALADASIYTSVEVVSKLTKLGDDMIHGREYKVGKDGTRIAPGGNRTGHPTGERPHYHRRVRGKGGNVKRGQGTDRHRPWDTSPEDKTFGDRF
nr:hypothetical protein [Kiritimatiellia bacterium]